MLATLWHAVNGYSSESALVTVALVRRLFGRDPVVALGTRSPGSRCRKMAARCQTEPQPASAIVPDNSRSNTASGSTGHPTSGLWCIRGKDRPEFQDDGRIVDENPGGRKRRG